MGGSGGSCAVTSESQFWVVGKGGGVSVPSRAAVARVWTFIPLSRVTRRVELVDSEGEEEAAFDSSLCQ